MTAANNRTPTVKGKEKNTQHIIVSIKKKSIKVIKHTNYELKT